MHSDRPEPADAASHATRQDRPPKPSPADEDEQRALRRKQWEGEKRRRMEAVDSLLAQMTDRELKDYIQDHLEGWAGDEHD
ncbi:hypothetical protein [Thermogemmata fonticola]|uniref:Uncharacterized protein n=1 Tax=Thermogemmata fonticola TaxID=2755323 RepID=A0A7V8VBH4_9BACT|nr:hypothetical protein [Thermogemmata fonticola]MBA2224667.1 hypothetical protein [Thermogemmata fonticola]